jgi:hypothetical protein
MQDRNPYAAPRATVAAAELDEDYGEIRVFTARGRLGRVRYIGYSLGLTFLFSVVLGIAAAIAIPAYQDYVQRAQAAQSQSE